MSTDQLNKLLKNKENFYLSLINAGLYLPPLESKAITIDYLISVINGEVFSIS